MNGPIFIGGPHRSGTGMLRAVIGSNSQVAIPPKEYLFFESLRPLPKIEAADKSGLLCQILNWPKVKEWGLSKEDVEAFAASESDAAKAVYAAPLLAYAHKLGKARFGVKTPYLEHNFEQLLHWFGPTTRFIQIMRDPLSTYRSAVYYSGFRSTPTPAQFSRRWRFSLLTGLRLSRTYPANFLLLRYEDFITDPRHWTGLLCEFANLSKELDRMLDMCDFKRKQNSSFADNRPVTAEEHRIIALSEIDRPALAPSIASQIAEEVFPNATQLGYVCPN